MADKWWEVLPLNIPEVRGNPMLAEMAPAPFAGFVRLLMAQWADDDGYLPANDDFLRAASGMRDEWPAHKRTILQMFEVGERGLAFGPMRERWEIRLELHERQSEAARRTNEALAAERYMVAERGGERGAVRQTGEKPEAPYVLPETRGSVIRASEGKTELGEKRTGALAGILQSPNAEKGSEEQQSQCQNGSQPERKSAPDASNGEDGPRQGARVSGPLVRELQRGVSALQARHDEALWRGEDAAKLGSRVVDSGDGTRTEHVRLASGIVFVPESGDGSMLVIPSGPPPPYLENIKAPGRDSEPEDEKQGAGVPATSSESLLGPPTAPFDPLNEGLDDDDADFLAAQKAAASSSPRRVATPARGGLRAW